MNSLNHIVFVESNRSGLNALSTAKEEGHHVTFIRSLDNAFLYEGERYRGILKQVDRVIQVKNSFSETELKNVLDDLHAVQPIDALVTVLEYAVIPVAICCEYFGLPGISKAAAMISRDKYQCNRRLANSGIKTTKCKLIRNNDEAVSSAIEIGYPVVIKPNYGCASLFVKVAKNKAEVIQAVRSYHANLSKIHPNIRAVIAGDLIVEEYLSGKMFSAEVGLSRDEFIVFTIGERKRSVVVEAIELGTTVPAPIDPPTWKAIATYAESVTRALALDQGLFHIELILTEDGPLLIDFNSRLMGGILPLLYNLAYKDNIFGYLLDAHLARPFRARPPKPERFATSRAFGSTEERQTNDTFDLSWMERFKTNDIKLDLIIQPGQTAPKLRSNHDYLGYLRVLGETSSQSAQLADEVLELLGNTLGIEMAN